MRWLIWVLLSYNALCYHKVMHILRKGKPNSILCEGLSHDEFKCKCDYDSCKITLISDKLLKAYWRLRAHVNVPLKITSGYRCPRHNNEIPGSNDRSYHQLGAAIDIAFAGSVAQKYSPHEFIKLSHAYGFTFGYFNQEKNFIHLEVGPLDG